MSKRKTLRPKSKGSSLFRGFPRMDSLVIRESISNYIFIGLIIKVPITDFV